MGQQSGTNHEWIAELIRDSSTAQLAFGVTLALLIGSFLLTRLAKFFGELREAVFGKQEEEKDPPATPQIMVIGTSDDLITKQQALLSMQQQHIESQQEFIKSLIDDRDLDDTIPFRDDLMNRLDVAKASVTPDTKKPNE